MRWLPPLARCSLRASPRRASSPGARRRPRRPGAPCPRPPSPSPADHAAARPCRASPAASSAIDAAPSRRPAVGHHALRRRPCPSAIIETVSACAVERLMAVKSAQDMSSIATARARRRSRRSSDRREDACHRHLLLVAADAAYRHTARGRREVTPAAAHEKVILTRVRPARAAGAARPRMRPRTSSASRTRSGSCSPSASRLVDGVEQIVGVRPPRPARRGRSPRPAPRGSGRRGTARCAGFET